MRGRVGLAYAHAGSGLHVPHLHLPVQVAKPRQTDKPAQVAPNHLVLVLLAELKRNHVVLSEKNGLGRHEPAYDQIVLALPVPLEVVKRALVGLHLCDFVGSVTVEVEPVLPIVRFSGGVEVGLQLDEETVGNRRKLDANFLRLVDAFLIEGFFLIMGKKQQVALIALTVQKGSSHQVALRFAHQRDLDLLDDPALDRPLQLSLRGVHLDGLGIVPEEQGVIAGKSDEGVAGLDIIVALCVFLEDGSGLERGQANDDGLALAGVDLVEQLHVLLAGGERDGV